MKLVNNLMELYPENITSLPESLFTPLMQSIVFGLEHEDMDIARLAFDAVTALAREERKQPRAEAPLARALVTFLHQILMLLFFGDYDADLVQNAAAATLHQLMLTQVQSVRPAMDAVFERAQSLVASMQSAQKMSEYLRHSILVEFAGSMEQVLTAELQGTVPPAARKQLKEQFEKSVLRVLSTVRGVVRVK
jgi:hypothetical protein